MVKELKKTYFKSKVKHDSIVSFVYVKNQRIYLDFGIRLFPTTATLWNLKREKRKKERFISFPFVFLTGYCRWPLTNKAIYDIRKNGYSGAINISCGRYALFFSSSSLLLPYRSSRRRRLSGDFSPADPAGYSSFLSSKVNSFPLLSSPFCRFLYMLQIWLPPQFASFLPCSS